MKALELLDAASLPYAKAVCVDACPSEFHRCRLGDLPCTAAAQYRCVFNGGGAGSGARAALD